MEGPEPGAEEDWGPGIGPGAAAAGDAAAAAADPMLLGPSGPPRISPGTLEETWDRTLSWARSRFCRSSL